MKELIDAVLMARPRNTIEAAILEASDKYWRGHGIEMEDISSVGRTTLLMSYILLTFSSSCKPHDVDLMRVAYRTVEGRALEIIDGADKKTEFTRLKTLLNHAAPF